MARPKFERGRRACSVENPPAHSELAKLTSFDNAAETAAKQEEIDESLRRLLDAKLESQEALPAPKRSLEMRRHDSIGPQTAPFAVGQKRLRPEVDSATLEVDDGLDGLQVKDSWASKRPRLSDEWPEQKPAAEATDNPMVAPKSLE